MHSVLALKLGVTLNLGRKVTRSKLVDPCAVYKMPLLFRLGVRDPFPPSPSELLELSAHPL
jgi:hypothetical protein